MLQFKTKVLKYKSNNLCKTKPMAIEVLTFLEAYTI